jgi:dienelactone hydrolase
MKRKLVMLVLCLISFVGGMTLHFLYPQLEPPLKTKAIQRWELRRTLQLVKAKLSDASLIEEKDMGSYVRRLLRFRWQELSYEAYLLIPKQQGKKTAAILAIHGHHTTKEDVVGIRRSRFGVDFGLRFVKSGFCVLAPDIPFSDDMKIEDHVALNLIMAGTTSLTGMRVSYLEALLEYLCSLPSVDPKRVGCIGWSMGGGLSMYLAAVDKRVKVVGISGYFGTYEGTFIRRRHTTDNYIPAIWDFGEMADVACLIAPRPLLIEGGDRDPVFPKEAFMKGIEDLKNCYEGHEKRLTWQLISGGHKFEGKGLEEWYKRWL